MKRRKTIDKSILDEEETQILSSYEKNEWKSVKNLKKEKAEAHKIAANTLTKDL